MEARLKNGDISFEAVQLINQSNWYIRNASVTYGKITDYYFPTDYGAEVAVEYGGVSYSFYVPLSNCEERYG